MPPRLFRIMPQLVPETFNGRHHIDVSGHLTASPPDLGIV
jgi:hypothetical protein